MADFTPGPWTYHKNEDGSATVTMPHEHIEKPCATCQANARLIAAAPELYEALQELIETVERFGLIHPDADDNFQWWPCLDEHYAALARVDKEDPQ